MCYYLNVQFQGQRVNPSGHAMALGSTQPQISTSGISLGVRQPVHKAHNLVTFLEILGASTSWSPKGLYRNSFNFPHEFIYIRSQTNVYVVLITQDIDICNVFVTNLIM